MGFYIDKNFGDRYIRKFLIPIRRIRLDTSRIYRFTIPGWLFIFSFIFHFWLLGANVGTYNIDILTTKGISVIISAFLVAFVATPALGFIISTVAVRILHWIYGYKFHLRLPQTEEEFDEYINALNSLMESFKIDPDIKKMQDAFANQPRNLIIAEIRHFSKRQHVKTLYVIFNLIRCIRSTNTLTEYTTRRWSSFWTHINCIASIVFGFIMAIFIILYLDDFHLTLFTNTFNIYRFLLEIPVFTYIFTAIIQLLEARNSAVDIEYKWLIEEAHENKNEIVLKRVTCNMK